jgi:hypothetical protein
MVYSNKELLLTSAYYVLSIVKLYCYMVMK